VRSANSLDRFFATLAGADADAVVHRQDKDLAVADLALVAAAAPFDDRVDRGFDEVIVHGDLQLHLAEQIHFVLVTAIELGLPLLPTKALAIEDGEAKDLDFGEGSFYFLELAGLNDGDDEFHKVARSVSEGARFGNRVLRVVVHENSIDGDTLADATGFLKTTRAESSSWLPGQQECCRLHRRASHESGPEKTPRLG
jgi:hypothetical protein